MSVYTCNYCFFNTPLAYNYKRHIETIRHKKNEEKHIPTIQNISVLDRKSVV
jgi:hypothetical protein